MKRFYKNVEAVSVEGGYEIHLDGRPVKTPNRTDLRLESHALAVEIAKEWQAQKDEIKPAEMHLTRYATSRIDLVTGHREAIVEEILSYIETDLLRYRASFPNDLVAVQAAAWDPWLVWFRDQFGVELPTTEGFDPVPTQPELLVSIRSRLLPLSDWELVGLHAGIKLTGSFVIGIALSKSEINGDEAFETAYLDDRYQQDKWGGDRENELRLNGIQSESNAVARWFSSIAG